MADPDSNLSLGPDAVRTLLVEMSQHSHSLAKYSTLNTDPSI